MSRRGDLYGGRLVAISDVQVVAPGTTQPGALVMTLGLAPGVDVARVLGRLSAAVSQLDVDLRREEDG